MQAAIDHALYARSGLEQQEHPRQHVFRAGRHADVPVMSRLSALLRAAL